MFTSRARGALTLDPPLLHRLSFLFRSIETVRRGRHLRRAQVSAPTNIEQHPLIHAALSEVIPLLRTRYHHSPDFTYFFYIQEHKNVIKLEAHDLSVS